MLAKQSISQDNITVTESELTRVNREGETRSVVRFLSNSEGGILLLGGDRGSGKTTLIETAIEQLERTRSDNLRTRVRDFTRAKLITIHIPLIVIDKHQANEQNRDIKEQYRSLLMRAMVSGMESDLLRRYSKHYQWLDLPQRWFRSVGYIQKVGALKPYSRYLSLNKTTSRTLSATTNLISTPALQNAISAEIDLSDSSLEMKLRDLLKEYSKIHQFIFVFDELDKLPETIELESLVLYLKNLFSETGVYAVFITDEKNLNRIISKSKTVPPTEISTLFVNHVLLNNMSRDQFDDVVRKNVRFSDAEQNAGQLLTTLSLLTHRSPHALSKVFIRYGRDFEGLLAGVKSELGTLTFNRFGVMQLFQDYINDIYSGLFDDAYYKRTLSGALEELGSILLNNESEYINCNYPLSIFYTSDHFPNEPADSDEDEATELVIKSTTMESFGVQPDIIKQINSLSDDQKVAISHATECLITLLNRSHNLNLTRYEKTVLLKLHPIISKQFAYERVTILDFNKVLGLTVAEQNIAKKIHTYGPAYSTLTGSSISGSVTPVDLKNVSDPLMQSKYTLSNTLIQWDYLRDISNRVQSVLFSAVFDKVNVFANKKYLKFVSRGNSAIVELANGKRYQVIVMYGSQHVRIRNDVEKTFILRDVSSRARWTKVSTKVRNFGLTPKWANFDTVAKQIAVWVDSQS